MRRHAGPLMLALAATLTLTLLASRPALAATDKCVDLPGPKINVNDMLGTWYPMEIVLHKNDSKIYGVPVDAPCAEVTIVPTSASRKSLRLVWNTTANGELEYRLSQRGVKDSAQFATVGDQIGPYVKEDYRQFGGTLHVINLDEKFLFATFCAKKGFMLSTVFLSRKDAVPEEVVGDFVQEIRGHVAKRIHVSDVCKPGTASVPLPMRVLPYISLCFVSSITRWLAH